ncbi:MAG: hypothetical protein JWQ14_3153 [Adhaeribacter sp.]|nr:hypothetical protein [Adhaeribacter sp.]
MRTDAEKNVEWIFEKLQNTIETYKALYPELLYLEQELKKTVPGEDNSEEAKLINLIIVNNWLKDQVMHYYVFRNISQHLEQDFVLLQKGLQQAAPDELYLEFARA